MQRKFFAVTFVVLSLVFMVSLAMASMPMVYVNNTPAGSAITVGNQVYVSLLDFLKAGGYNWKVEGKKVKINVGYGPRDAVNFIPDKYAFKNSDFDAHTFYSAGKLMVNANAFSYSLGLNTRYTPNANVYDYFSGKMPPARQVAVNTPLAPPASPTSTGVTNTPTASPAADTEVVEGKVVTFKNSEVSKSVVKPLNNYFWDFNTGEVRGEVFFSNTDKEKIRQVSIVFKIVDGDGDTLWSKQYDIGDMESGDKTKKYDYYWLNPSKFDINQQSFQYEIKYQEPDQVVKKEDKK